MSVSDVLDVFVMLGIPDNILSAMPRRVTNNNSSAVYLAALAIDELALLLFAVFLCDDGWFCASVKYLAGSAAVLAPLLVLSFSVERLIAILRSLQVSSPFY